MTDAVTAPEAIIEAAPPVVPPVTPPVVAPAVVPPVTPPVIADAVEGGVEYETTGDAGLDVALSFIGKLGLGPDNAAVAAAMAGDFSILKATLAAMGDKAKGYEQMIALGEAAHKAVTDKAAAAKVATDKAVHEMAGGAENWTKVQAWAATEASPEEKAEINKLFDSGILGARAAALLLATQYNAAKGTVVRPSGAVRPGGTSATTITTNGPLNPREYGAAVRELSTKLGNRMDASPEYAALKARLRR